MNIYVYGSKILRTVSNEIEISRINNTLDKLLDDMVDTMRKANGCGLASNQVGIDERYFVIEVDGIVKKYINPEILEYGKELSPFDEGCLSIPGIYKNVNRPSTLKVRYYNEKGEQIEENLDGMWARVYQHEFDHINGKMFVDRVEPVAKSLIRKKLEKLKKNNAPRVFD